MTTIVNPQEARTRLPELLEMVEAGEEVVIARDGQPVAKIVKSGAPEPAQPGATGAVIGMLRGKVWISPDFDDPLSDEEMALYEGPLISSNPSSPG